MKYKVCICSICFLIVAFSTSAQEGINSKEASYRLNKAKEIIDNSRLAAFGKRNDEELRTIKLVTSGETYVKQKIVMNGRGSISNETHEKQNDEILLSLPDEATYRSHLESNNQITNQNVVTNLRLNIRGNEIDKNIEASINGKPVDLDNKSKGLRIVGETQSPSIKEESAAVLFESLFSELFPFILRMSNTSGHLTYIGSAEAEGIKVNVLEYVNTKLQGTESNDIETRYFFDTKTFRLLMVSITLSNTISVIKTKTYYSKFEVRNGVIIPTMIRKEVWSTLKKQFRVAGIHINQSTEHKISEHRVDEFIFNAATPVEVPD